MIDDPNAFAYLNEGLHGRIYCIGLNAGYIETMDGYTQQVLLDIRVPNGVIGVHGFAYDSWTPINYRIAAVTLPSTISVITDYNLFRGAPNLRYVKFDNCDPSWSYNGYEFEGCSKLEYVDFGVNMRTLASSTGGLTFKNCVNLKNIVLPPLLTEIPAGCFAGAGIERINLHSNITKIGASAFEGCMNLKQIAIPPTITSIGANAFQGSGLTSVVIPGNIATVAYRLFYNCPALSYVIIKAGVQTLGEEAFRDCLSLRSIIIPYSVTDIGLSCFYSTPMVVVYTEHVGKPEGWVHDYEGLFDNSSTVRYVVWACDTGFDLEDVIYRTDGRIKVILSEPNFNLGPEDVLHYFWYVSHYGGMFEIIDGVEGLDYTFDVTDLGAIYACRAILDGVILHEYIYRPDPMAIVGMILESVDAISEGIKELYGQIEAQAEGISAIWGEIEGIGGEIGELGEILEGLEGEIGELAEAIETILELLSNIGEVDLTEIGEAIGEIVAAIAEIGGEMDGIGVTIKTIDEKIAAIIAANEAQDESIEKLEQTVAELREKILELEAANAAMWEAINSIEVPEIPPYPEWPPYVPEEGGESGGNYDRVGSIFVYAGVGVFGVVFCFFIWLGMMVAVRAVRR